MSQRRVVPVVCAVLEDAAGRVLLAQRPAHKHLGLKWEFAGGKIEAGETPEAALHRELREELGCRVIIRRPLPPFRHDYGDVLIEMFPFVCHLDASGPAPHAHEHVELRWMELTELTTMDLAPADWPVVHAYTGKEA